MSYGVCCVVGHLNDEIVGFIEYQCMEAGIPFKMREYDSWKYVEDREYISALPAFHIYKAQKRYKITISSDENIMEVVKDYINKKNEKAEKRRRQWNKWFGFLQKRRVLSSRAKGQNL